MPDNKNTTCRDCGGPLNSGKTKGCCDACLRPRQVARLKAWRDKNKQHVKEYAVKYREGNEAYAAYKREADRKYYHEVEKNDPDAMKRRADYGKAYAAAHPEKGLARSARFKAKNRQKLNAEQKAKYQALTEDQRKAITAARREYLKQYRQTNAAKLSEWSRANYEANKESLAVDAKAYYEQNRHAFIARAEDRQRKLSERGTHTAEDIQNLYRAQGGKCAACKLPIENTRSRSAKRGFEVDHVMPVSLGGMNTADNLALTCRSCNRRKRSKHPDQWAVEIGKLFV
jgi:5-methylcytosine-specific restriction endonuclease McrA